MRNLTGGRAALVMACGVLTALLAPALLGQAILGFRDMLHNYGPMRHLFWSGEVTLWNDRAFGGGAILPDLVQQPFYLGNLLFRLLHVPERPGSAINIWIHVLFGGWATYALARRFTEEPAAAVGATSYVLCGFTIADFSNPQWACAAAWAPAVLLAADLWLVEGGTARAALVGLSLPQTLLSGDVLMCALLVPVAFAISFQRRKRRSGGELVAEAMLISVGALLIACPQLVATMRAMHLWTRHSGLPRDIREQWSLHPARLPELYVPRLYGPLFTKGFWGQFTVSQPWKRNYVHSIYAGSIGPALIAAAFWGRPSRRQAFLCLAALVPCLLLAMGDHFFHLYGLVGESIPGFRVFRYPQRLVALAVPLWSILLALGAHEITRFRVAGRMALAFGAGALAAATLSVVARYAPPASPDAFLHSLAQILIVTVASAAALIAGPRMALFALSIVLALDLAAANGELLGLLPLGPFREPPAACAALEHASRGLPRHSFRVYIDQEHIPMEHARWAEQRIFEYQVGKRNLVEVCGFRESVALSSLDPVALTRLWRDVSPRRALDALGTRFVLTVPSEVPAWKGVVRASDPRWGFVVAELPGASPVLFRPLRVERMDAGQIVEAARIRGELLRSQIVTVGEPLRDHEADGEARLFDVQHAPERIEFSVAQSRPGYWVLSETMDSDWSGSVDGAHVRIVEADLVRRAIWVPPGEHRVVLVYRPWLLGALFALSLLGIAALLLVAVSRL